MFCVFFRINLVSINEMVLAMRRLQKLPDETKLQHIMDVLDEDHDGNIDIDDALKVCGCLAIFELIYYAFWVFSLVLLLAFFIIQ